MNHNLEAIFGIVTYMAGIAAIFIGFGVALQGRFHVPINLDRLLVAFWVGYAVTIGFLQIWHLFFAVTWHALAIVALCGFASLWWNRIELLIWMRTLKRQTLALGILCTLLAAVWVANHAAGVPDAFDSGMYHVQAVRWYRSYPVVFGLGNLHDRLAFNTSSLLYDAMLEFGPWAGRATHVANGLLVFAVLLRILASALRTLRARGNDVGPYLFDLVLLPPVVAIAVSEDISSFATDIPPAMVLFTVCSQAYRLLSTRRSGDSCSAYSTVVLVMLSVLAATLKASYIVVAALLIAAVSAFFVLEASRAVIARVGKWSAAVTVLLAAPWLVHGLILSGYPLYPSTLGGLPVDWRVPTDLGTATRLWVVAFARHSIAGGLSWVAAWIKHIMHWSYNNDAGQEGAGLFGVLAPLSVVAACLLGIVLAGHKPSFAVCMRNTCLRNRGWWLILTCVVGVVVWFFTAPGPRFGFALLWSLAAACVAQSAVLYRPRVQLLALPTAFAAALIPVVFPIPPGDAVNTIIRRAWLPPGPDHGLYPYSKAELQHFTTQSGLLLYVPVNDNRCYDAPLPCTPHPAPDLMLTHARDGRPKFVTNGSWQQINWPNPSHDPFKEMFLTRLRARLSNH